VVNFHMNKRDSKKNKLQQLMRAGKFVEAKAVCRRLCRSSRNDSDLFFSMGTVHAQLGENSDAITAFEQVLRLTPKDNDARYNLASLYVKHGELEKGEACYRYVIKAVPGMASASLNLAVLLRRKGLLDEADSVVQAGLQYSPENLDMQLLRANILRDQESYAAAIEIYRAIILKAPAYVSAYINLADVLRNQNELEQAASYYQHALKIKPDMLQSLRGLGMVNMQRKMYAQAIDCFRKELTLTPNDHDAQLFLGMALAQDFKLTDAITVFEKMISSWPDSALAKIQAANVFRQMGRCDEARNYLEQVLRNDPENIHVLSDLLFLLSYHVLCSPQEMLEAHQEWDQKQGQLNQYHHTEKRDIDKQLRIAYVSPDLCGHSVAYFMAPILESHNKEDFEVYCYAGVEQPDAMTEHLQSVVSCWRSTLGLTAAQLAEKIYADKIDILVDLAGHTAGNRLDAFAFKPAPIQISYLGYFTTTGLSTMDYWLTDSVLHPAGTVELATERLWRMPRSCLAYHAPKDAPDVLPREEGTAVTFGCFNDLSKVSEAALELWIKILHKVPGSRLLLKARQLGDASLRLQLQQYFEQQGIAAERVELLPVTQKIRDHLLKYHEVDIALDTIPRTGGASTAEALWMGVPVVTLAGERYIERLSASMLTAVGLEELIASSSQEYIETAVELAQDIVKRATLRQGLRQQMTASALCDAKGLTQVLEQQYRQMWLE